MDVTEQQLIELIRKGEGLDLEFKACRNQLTREVPKLRTKTEAKDYEDERKQFV